MQEFPKNYNFHEIEKKWQKFWQDSNLYAWNPKSKREDSFVVDTPPPTVSGELHIGHVYSYLQTDFIVRFHRMRGKNIFYPMGFDDNGLPTERLVEKKKNIKAYQMDRQEFIATCREVVIDEEKKFRALFNDIALSIDWNLEYQTISPLSQKLSQMSFLDLLQKGEIYRASQPILWDPIDGTALAQADIEDKEKQGSMNEIAFITEKGEEIIIATTRPELLPACVCIFYHPEDERYNHLQGQNAITPLFSIKVPIIADELVLPEKGTGLVMCCTFGDQTDILWWRKHKLQAKIILNKQGVLDNFDFTESINKAIAEIFGKELEGLKVNAARNKILNLLKEQNLLKKQTEIISVVKCAERSGAPLEILMHDQWFIKTIEHKEQLLHRANELKWHPSSMKIKLENWINGISWDWCISRSRFFGVPFPIWYSKRAGEEGKILTADINSLPIDPIKDLPDGYSIEEVEPDFDVMDTWATSSISPQLSSHAISENFAVDFTRHKQLFPFDLRPQAHEIIRTWAFYTILKAHLHQDCLPWKNIIISGWCLAEDRSKMSKSKGNVITPHKLLEQYGADVIRYWAASSDLGADTAYSEDVLKAGKRLVNKLWNAAKFAHSHFDKIQTEDKESLNSDKICNQVDRYFLTIINRYMLSITELLQVYEYAKALKMIEDVFFRIYCDNYLEIIKIRCYNQDNRDIKGSYSAILGIYHSFKMILKLFAPFLPHITEEIYQLLYHDKIESIHQKNTWPISYVTEILKCDSKQIDAMLDILECVRKIKGQKNLSVKAPIEILEIEGIDLASDITSDLKDVTGTKEIKLVNNSLSFCKDINNDIHKIHNFYIKFTF